MLAIRDKVRFGETDKMGLVYHPNYLHWLEMGRIAYLEQGGVGLNELMEAGIHFPIREINVKYLSPMTYGDSYEVRTTMSECNKIKMVFTYQVIRLRDGAVAVEGSTSNVFTNAVGRVARLPEQWFQKLQALYEQENKAVAEENEHE